MKPVRISEFDSNLLFALTETEKKGEIFIIYRNGKPIANLIPHIRKSRRSIHPVMSDIKINYDPTETLSHDEWSEEDN